jgi:hypothetical protein
MGGSGGGPPPAEAYVSYFGGTDQDQLRGTALDAAGNVYFTGGTLSAGLSSCAGTHQGNYDVIVGRIDADGSLGWCRYLGGPQYDRFYDIEVNAAGTQVVVGGRASAGFPVTGGAWDTTFNNGQSVCGGPYGTQDAAVCALDAATGAVAWCTYVGFSNGCDFLRTIALDDNDNVILGNGFVGAVNDPQYNALFLNSSGGGQDGVVGKLSADGSTLAWYRYVGGSGDSAVEGMVAVDSAGIYYTPAWTNDTSHAIVGGFDATHNGGTDQYLARLSLDGQTITYATYIGGSGGDDTGVHGVVTSGTPGVVFVKAGTTSTDWPTTAGAISQARQGPSDCAVVKIDTNQTGAASLLGGTYLGGGGDDFCEGMALAGGALALGGSTTSTNFPVTAGALMGTSGGGEDGWVALVSGDLTTIVYASYMGGGAADAVRAVDADGLRILGVGVTDSANLPVTANAAQSAHASPGSQWDAMVAVFPY